MVALAEKTVVPRGANQMLPLVSPAETTVTVALPALVKSDEKTVS